jgi:hypothetical protein
MECGGDDNLVQSLPGIEPIARKSWLVRYIEVSRGSMQDFLANETSLPVI